jgi:hypothetical protein
MRMPPLQCRLISASREQGLPDGLGHGGNNPLRTKCFRRLPYLEIAQGVHGSAISWLLDEQGKGQYHSQHQGRKGNWQGMTGTNHLIHGTISLFPAVSDLFSIKERLPSTKRWMEPEKKSVFPSGLARNPVQVLRIAREGRSHPPMRGGAAGRDRINATPAAGA